MVSLIDGDDDIGPQDVEPARRVVDIVHIEAEGGLIVLGEDSGNHCVTSVLEEEVGHRPAIHPLTIVSDEVHDLIFGERK